MKELMVSIGIDSVDIERFAEWSDYSLKQLHKIYTTEELRYALSNPQKQAERLAVRYAAKEAFYKALAPVLSSAIPFLKLCKLSSIETDAKGMPTLTVDWNKLSLNDLYSVTVSLTHSRTQATAVVIILNKKQLSEKAL